MNYIALSIIIVLFLVGSLMSAYELMKRIPMMKQKKTSSSQTSKQMDDEEENYVGNDKREN